MNPEHFGEHQELCSVINHFTKPAFILLVHHALYPPTGCHSPSSFLLRNVRRGESCAISRTGIEESWELVGKSLCDYVILSYLPCTFSAGHCKFRERVVVGCIAWWCTSLVFFQCYFTRHFRVKTEGCLR